MGLRRDFWRRTLNLGQANGSNGNIQRCVITYLKFCKVARWFFAGVSSSFFHRTDLAPRHALPR